MAALLSIIFCCCSVESAPVRQVTICPCASHEGEFECETHDLYEPFEAPCWLKEEMGIEKMRVDLGNTYDIIATRKPWLTVHFFEHGYDDSYMWPKGKVKYDVLSNVCEENKGLKISVTRWDDPTLLDHIIKRWLG